MKSAGLYYTGCEEPHCLESCFLCHKSLDNNSDIFMNGGNTPFCSQECRQDEGVEKRWKVSSSKRSTTNSTNKSSASTKTVQTAQFAGLDQAALQGQCVLQGGKSLKQTSS